MGERKLTVSEAERAIKRFDLALEDAETNRERIQNDLVSALAGGIDTAKLQQQAASAEAIIRAASAAKKVLKNQLEAAEAMEKAAKPEFEKLLQLIESFRAGLTEAERTVGEAWEEVSLAVAGLRKLDLPTSWELKLKIAFSQDADPVPNPMFARPDEDQAPGRSGRVHEALGGFRRALLNYVDDWARVIRTLLGTPALQPPAAEPQPAGEPQPAPEPQPAAPEPQPAAPEPEKLEGRPIKSHAEIERLRREKDQW